MTCRHCGKPLHRDPAGMWLHSASLRVRCADNEHDAEPHPGGDDEHGG